MQWISFKGQKTKEQEFVNLDMVQNIRVSEKEIIFFFENDSYLISKETLPETYQFVKDYLEFHLDYYKIN